MKQYDNLAKLRLSLNRAGQKVYVKSHTTEGDGGGGEFWLDTSDTTTADDNGINIVDSQSPRTGTWKRIWSGDINVKWFGAVGDGATDDSTAIQAGIDLAVTLDGSRVILPDGDYLVGAKLNAIHNEGVSIVGSGRFSTKLTIATDITLIEHGQYLHISDLTLEQTGTTGTGRALSTTSTGQAAHCSFHRLRFVNFKFGILLRYSLWTSFRDLRFNGCTAGIRLARNDDMENQTNPAATGAWNVAWFHNQLTFDNILFEGGEVGLWGSCMGGSFNNVTAQNQDSDGTSNSVLPSGEVGTGIWIEEGSSSSKTYNVTFENYYSEGTQRTLKFVGCRKVMIDGWFVQGNTLGSPYYTAIDVDDSDVYSRGSTGQDYFQHKIVGTNSAEIFGFVAGSATVSSASLDSTSTWYDNNEEPQKFVNNYFFNKANGLTNQNYDLFQILDNSTYIVQLTGLHDGATHRNATYHVTKWTSTALSSVDLSTGTEVGWAASVSAGMFRISVSQSLSLQAYISVYKLTEFGPEAITVTAI